jgi:hypothetical protein
MEMAIPRHINNNEIIAAVAPSMTWTRTSIWSKPVERILLKRISNSTLLYGSKGQGKHTMISSNTTPDIVSTGTHSLLPNADNNVFGQTGDIKSRNKVLVEEDGPFFKFTQGWSNLAVKSTLLQTPRITTITMTSTSVLPDARGSWDSV